MTRDDIIKLMQQACDSDKKPAWHNDFWTITQGEIERFAELVAAAERKECAAVADKHAEECYVGDSDWYEARNIAKAIRARGKK